jgi:hypothetical protein
VKNGFLSASQWNVSVKPGLPANSPTPLISSASIHSFMTQKKKEARRSKEGLTLPALGRQVLERHIREMRERLRVALRDEFREPRVVAQRGEPELGDTLDVRCVFVLVGVLKRLVSEDSVLVVVLEGLGFAGGDLLLGDGGGAGDDGMASGVERFLQFEVLSCNELGDVERG